MSAKWLCIDCETGGIEAKDCSLLSAYLEVLDENYETIDSLELFLKPNDGVYHVTSGSLKVNGIDLTKHEEVAKTYSQAGNELFQFIKKHSEDGKIKLISLGQNIVFDVIFINERLLKKTTWNAYVSYRSMDTSVLGRGLIEAGLIPDTITGSLESFGEYFDIPITKLHDAREDVKLNVAVFRKMIELIRGGNEKK